MTGLFAGMAVFALLAFLPIASQMDSVRGSTKETAHLLMGLNTMLLLVGVVGCAASQ